MTPVDGNGASGHPRQRRREPADTHFRKMGDAGNTQRGRRADSLGATPCRFEIYRADEVKMTSTHFSGGDWHWRLCDEAGQVLVDAGGYRNEQGCRSAIAILQDRAALATVWTGA